MKSVLLATLLSVSAFIREPPASMRGASVSASVPHAVTTSQRGRFVLVTVTF